MVVPARCEAALAIGGHDVRRHGDQVEPSLASAAAGSRFQFERRGYFAADLDTSDARPVFNRIVTLRDTWARIARATKPGDSVSRWIR